MKVGVHQKLHRGTFLADGPAVQGRLQQTRYLNHAKSNFADQADVDSFVTARGGAPADWVCVDLGAVVLL